MELMEYEGSVLAQAAESIAGYLADMTVDLYQEQIDIEPGNTVDEFVAAVANYTGYAQKVVTWGPVTISDEGVVEVLGTMTLFRPTGTTVENIVYGIFCRQDTTGTLLFAAAFENGIGMGSTLDQITVTLRYRPATSSLMVVIS